MKKRLLPNEPISEGWYKGRLKSTVTTQDCVWINNGTKSKFFPKDEEIPMGWVKGRIKSQLNPSKQKQTMLDKKFKHYTDGVNYFVFGEAEEVPNGLVPGRPKYSDEFKEKLSDIYHNRTRNNIIETYGSLENFYSSLHKKGDETKKKNGTLNKSKPEDEMYKSLCEQYGKNDVLRHYKDDKYPYYCDFYIKSINQYIELNLHWTHGSKPYDKEDDFCKKQLEVWKEKAKTSKFYENAIETWTIRDVAKLDCAIKNHLNYKVIY